MQFTEDGKAVVNAEVRSAAQGMGIGTQVRWRRSSAAVEKGVTGIVVGFQEKKVRVKRDDSEAVVSVAVGALMRADEKECENNADDDNETADGPKQKRELVYNA